MEKAELFYSFYTRWTSLSECISVRGSQINNKFNLID